MLGPAAANVLSFYYPLGNTPATSWTQDVPHGQKATVLSLGCGDVRKILFSSHCLPDSGELDITCCDVESTVIARNILFLSLILDNDDSTQLKSIWDIYYHVRINHDALALLEAQARKLEKLGDSLVSWHNGPYGNLLRICDSGSLLQIRKAWRGFASSLDINSGKSRFEHEMQRARSLRQKMIGENGTNLTGLRSTAPLIAVGIQDLSDIHRQFWETGTLDSASMASEAPILNPTFVSHSTTAPCLHYGTDPLLGFHLAAAYAPMAVDRDFELDSSLKTTSSPIVLEARLQLQEWIQSFRKASSHGLTLRFYVGEALSFCHVLNAKSSEAKAEPRIYRGPNSFETVSLNSEDYGSTGTAPRTFDIIDSSNLMDHVGPISLLIAAAPLLSDDAHATLHTEMLVKRDVDREHLVDSVLSGNFPMMATLLGLFPSEYWTNATTLSSVSEIVSDKALTTQSGKSKAGQMRAEFAWKRSIPNFLRERYVYSMPPVKHHEKDLAEFLIDVYRNMLEHMDPLRSLEELSLQSLRNLSVPRHHQGTFAMLLRFIQSRDVVQDWSKMMDHFLDKISTPSEMLHYQQLLVRMHLMGVRRYSEDIMRPLRSQSSSAQGDELQGWTSIPDTMCITFSIPRSDVDLLIKAIDDQPGAHSLQCQLRGLGAESQSWLNIFEVVHYTFGQVSTSGQRNTNSFQVHIEEDAEGWRGRSPMVVSFMAPTWAIISEYRSAFVSLNLQNTPSSIRLSASLGLNLKVSETTLADEKRAFLAKDWPNQAEDIGSAIKDSYPRPAVQSASDGILFSVEAVQELHEEEVPGWKGRIDLEAEHQKSILREPSAKVNVAQSSPFSVLVTIGNGDITQHISFPSPISTQGSKTRIARKSSYIEVIVPIADPALNRGLPSLLFPLAPTSSAPALWNIPRINLDRLLRLDLNKKKEMEWLVTHCSTMISAGERPDRDPDSALSGSLRVDVKESLFSLFMQFSGQQGQRIGIFGLNNPNRGGIHILILPSCMRLDPASRSVVLDCAILALTHEMIQTSKDFLSELSRMQLGGIQVGDDELELWKSMIPAFVERCRDWRHRPQCEYIAQNRIPVSTKDAESPLCSCGANSVPKDYITGIPQWESVRKHAIRAAISPIYVSPFIEDPFRDMDLDVVDATEPSAEAVDRDHCYSCGKSKADNGGRLLVCTRCKEAKYCSSECQRADWKSHKTVCGK